MEGEWDTNNDENNVSHFVLGARPWTEQAAASFQQLPNQAEEDGVFFSWGRGDEGAGGGEGVAAGQGRGEEP